MPDQSPDTSIIQKLAWKLVTRDVVEAIENHNGIISHEADAALRYFEQLPPLKRKAGARLTDASDLASLLTLVDKDLMRELARRLRKQVRNVAAT